MSYYSPVAHSAHHARALILLLISPSPGAAHKRVLYAASDVGPDDIAVRVDSKCTSESRSRKINRTEFALSRPQETMNPTRAIAAHAHNVALRVHLPGLGKRGARVIKRRGLSSAQDVSAHATQARVHEKSDHDAAAWADAVVHEPNAAQPTVYPAEETKIAGIQRHAEHRRGRIRVMNTADKLVAVADLDRVVA